MFKRIGVAALIAVMIMSLGAGAAIAKEKKSKEPKAEKAKTSKSVKDIEWCFTFSDGWSDCGTAEKNDTEIHGMLVHVSCSAVFDEDGYSDKGQPERGTDDPTIVTYSIRHYTLDKEGNRVLKKDCTQTFASLPEEPAEESRDEEAPPSAVEEDRSEPPAESSEPEVNAEESTEVVDRSLAESVVLAGSESAEIKVLGVKEAAALPKTGLDVATTLLLATVLMLVGWLARRLDAVRTY